MKAAGCLGCNQLRKSGSIFRTLGNHDPVEIYEQTSSVHDLIAFSMLYPPPKPAAKFSAIVFDNVSLMVNIGKFWELTS